MMPRHPTAPYSADALAAVHFGRGVLAGLTPLLQLAALTAVALGLTALSRLFTAPGGFFLEQQVAVIVLAVGLLATIALYFVGCVRVLRRAHAWWQAGESGAAAGALGALGAIALVVLLPVILVVVLPQHPAP